MNPERVSPPAQRMQAAIAELQERIRDRYPAASFRVQYSPDEPEAVLLKTMVDVEDRDEVLDVVAERMMQLQIEEGLPIFVVPIRPPERNRAMRRVAAANQTLPNEPLPLYP